MRATQRRPNLSTALRRFATARVPIEVHEFDSVIGDGEDADLLTRCFFATARVPIEVHEFDSVIGDGEDADLLTRCFCYGDGKLVMNEYVRAALRGQWDRDRTLGPGPR